MRNEVGAVYDILAFNHIGRGSNPPCIKSLGVCIKAFYSCFGEVAGESSRGEAAHRISCAFLLGGLLIFCVWVG
jgi:hypothetical protein